MRFIDREREIKLLRNCRKLSENKLYTLAIYGLRRVGKTRLILEALGEKGLYFFVNKYKTSESLLSEYEASLKAQGVLGELEGLGSWEDFFKILFERFKGTVAFDEFQNFIEVDKSVYGILQKNLDLYEQRGKILVIFSGSIVGLVKKLFFDSKEPLYGRVKRSLHLKPLNFENVQAMCKEIKIKSEDSVKLYAIFGGFPKYYVSIEDEGLCGKSFEEIMERFFFEPDAVLEDEVMNILAIEFGKRSGTYYDILTAIASGNTRISEIASFMRKKETAITRQVNELIHYFEIIGVEKTVLGDKKRLFIKHPLMEYWFKFFYKNLSDYKRRNSALIKKVRKQTDSHIGRRFEHLCRESLERVFPDRFERFGRQWGKIKGKPKGQNTYEIDIVALNEKTKEILFAECKWKSRVNAEKLCKELSEKAGYVEWNNGNRKEFFAIFAKSFSKRIKEFEGKRVSCFDLKDIMHAFQKPDKR